MGKKLGCISVIGTLLFYIIVWLASKDAPTKEKEQEQIPVSQEERVKSTSQKQPSQRSTYKKPSNSRKHSNNSTYVREDCNDGICLDKKVSVADFIRQERTKAEELEKNAQVYLVQAKYWEARSSKKSKKATKIKEKAERAKHENKEKKKRSRADKKQSEADAYKQKAEQFYVLYNEAIAKAKEHRKAADLVARW